MKVLLADDEEVVRMVGAEVLVSAGYDVVQAEDGRQAVELFDDHEEEWVLVVLDVGMPRLSGERVFEHIRARRPDLPVILATGFSAEEVADRFGHEPIAGFLQKPFPCDDLTDLVAEILGTE